MTYIIQCVGSADGSPRPGEEGMYFESFRHEAQQGSYGYGYAEFTADPRRAMQFATVGEAIEFWRRPSKTRPLRPDGKPNRPMTAWTVNIRQTHEAATVIRFSDLSSDENGAARETNIRTLKQSDISRCPHVIFLPDHYRDDGSCKCNDPDETAMREWGYRWSKKLKRWN
jgi:hypothetical protein